MLIRTKICGTLMCSGGIFSNPNSLEPALNATGLEVSGNVLLHNGFKAEGEVSLVGATIRGNFECNQGLFINKGSVAINGERLNVDGDVFLCQGSWGRDEGVQKEGFRGSDRLPSKPIWSSGRLLLRHHHQNCRTCHRCNQDRP